MSPLLRLPALRAAGAALACVAGFAADTTAQVDFRITSVETNQRMPSQAGQHVADAGTFVRATIRMVNGAPGTAVDGIARVFVDGVEADFSPLFSNNGPIVVVQPPNLLVEDHTLNFQFLAPESNDVVVEVTLNPAGPNQVAGEVDFSNNTLSTQTLSYKKQNLVDMAYAPVDAPTQGGPPSTALIEPGVGDNFIQGIFPVSDWDYRRIDAPTKFWGSSLSGTGSSLNNSLTADAQLMVPQPEFIYGWVNGSLPYNGQALINGIASMGNTQPIRHQRTFAHEVGHNTGLFHNGSKSTFIGIDPEEHLKITENIQKIFPSNKNDIMVAGQLTNTAWMVMGSYNVWLNHPRFQPGFGALTAGDDAGPGMLVAGVWNSATGSVVMTDVLTLPGEVRYSEPSEHGSEILLEAFADGRLVRRIPVASVSSDDCAGRDPSLVSPEVGFTALIPTEVGGQTVNRVVVRQGGLRALDTLVMTRSDHAPEVAFTSPVATVLGDSRVNVSWEGSDADGDELTYYLRYSRDGVQFSPLHTSTRDTSFTVDLAELPTLVDGQGFFELFATDGLNTTSVRTEPLRMASFAALGGNAPWVHVQTPDDGFDTLFGATVILHGMAWDLEDKSIQGGDVVWLSDLDGVIGTGRRTTTAELSAGTHVITMRATDGDGLVSEDSATIVVAPRDLPDVDGKLCQTDLGFGGPGSSVLSICGGDLSGGSSAELLLTDAPADTPAFVIVSDSNLPTPSKGGLVVPVPPLAIQALSTNASGELTQTVPGGFGPLTLYVQCAVVDGSQAGGFGFSNALQVDFLP